MTVPARKTRAERDVRRQYYIDQAIARARKTELTMGCADFERHEQCVGEAKGNHGCLCTCHDDARDAAALDTTPAP